MVTVGNRFHKLAVWFVDAAERCVTQGKQELELGNNKVAEGLGQWAEVYLALGKVANNIALWFVS